MSKKQKTLNELLEKILVEHVAISELRDVYRKQYTELSDKMSKASYIEGSNASFHCLPDNIKCAIQEPQNYIVLKRKHPKKR